jgi:transcriptional antiterminator RfaH
VVSFVTSKNWFIIKYNPNASKKAVQNLNQQGFKTFLLLQEVSVCKGDTFVSSLHPLFPEYMFISFGISIDAWSKINNTYGASKIVTFKASPSPISEKIIIELQIRYNKKVYLYLIIL